MDKYCISNEDLINYRQNNNDISDSDREKIGKHLLTCKECRTAFTSLGEIESLVDRMNATQAMPEDDDPGMCEYWDTVDAYLEGTLTDMQKDEYEHHMLGCKFCRELLVDVRMLEMQDGSIIEEKQPEYVWRKLKEGVMELAETIKLQLNSVGNGKLTPALAQQGIKYRDTPGVKQPKSIAVSVYIEEESCEVIITKIDTGSENVKLNIEMVYTGTGDVSIEIRDNGGRLKRGENKARPVSCMVKKGIYTVTIRIACKEYKINLDLNENPA